MKVHLPFIEFSIDLWLNEDELDEDNEPRSKLFKIKTSFFLILFGFLNLS
jgi:hypothetical protein